MSEDKFLSDTKTVLKFIQIYCDKQHEHAQKSNESMPIEYKNLKDILNYNLCSDCKRTFVYSYHRLQECPNDPKPMCRKCPSPCYEKKEWKLLAKIMRYSGMQMGLLKIRKLFSKK